tara:strand:+ start:855 stop:1739 length:885 start_codon:yes stop_codon:yes gene_type:complete
MIFIYVYFLNWNNNQVNELVITEQQKSFGIHQNNMSKLAKIDGLILGGSNAGSGLSAQVITESLGRAWYNLYLPGEGKTDKKYWSFVTQILSEGIRSNVRTIVYSSAIPLHKDTIGRRYNREITQLKHLLIPSKSLSAHFKDYFFPSKNLGPIKNNTFGDRNFNSVRCLDSNKLKLVKNTREINENQLRSWVIDQLEVLLRIFPNAKIFFVIPSEYYLNKDEERSEKNAEIINSGISVLTATNNVDITLIKQSDYPSIDMLCTDSFHANSIGREWRTKEILQYLSASLPYLNNN